MYIANAYTAHICILADKNQNSDHSLVIIMFIH